MEVKHILTTIVDIKQDNSCSFRSIALAILKKSGYEHNMCTLNNNVHLINSKAKILIDKIHFSEQNSRGRLLPYSG